MIKTNIKELNSITKILLVFLIIVVSYFIILLVLTPFFAPVSMMDMMNQIMIRRGTGTNLGLISLIFSLVIGIILSFYLFENKKDKEFNIIRKALSEDERKVLDEIKKAKEITQDSLRFRLNWSKAKISTILTNLDKRNLIQRQRTGKTYKVYLEKMV